MGRTIGKSIKLFFLKLFKIKYCQKCLGTHVEKGHWIRSWDTIYSGAGGDVGFRCFDCSYIEWKHSRQEYIQGLNHVPHYKVYQDDDIYRDGELIQMAGPDGMKIDDISRHSPLFRKVIKPFFRSTADIYYTIVENPSDGGKARGELFQKIGKLYEEHPELFKVKPDVNSSVGERLISLDIYTKYLQEEYYLKTKELMKSLEE